MVKLSRCDTLALPPLAQLAHAQCAQHLTVVEHYEVHVMQLVVAARLWDHFAGTAFVADCASPTLAFARPAQVSRLAQASVLDLGL